MVSDFITFLFMSVYMIAIFPCPLSELMHRYLKNSIWFYYILLNILRPRQNGRHFIYAIFKWIFLNENVWIPIKISLKFVPQGPINDIPALVQIMAWRQPGDKPLSGPMMVRLPMHICVTRPQWVNMFVVKLCMLLLLSWFSIWNLKQ